MKKETISKYLNPLYPIPTDLLPRGTLRHRVRCMLYDIYGTLFISGTGDVSTAKKASQTRWDMEQVLAKFAVNRSVQSVLKDFYNNIEEKHQQMRKSGIDFPEIEVDKIWMEILDLHSTEKAKDFAVEFELLVNPVYPMPHLAELLTACEKGHMRMGIISNAQFFTLYLFDWFLDADPERLGFDPELLFYSYRFGYGKPSVHMFQKAAEKVKNKKIQPHSVLYIGNDMLNDVYPARQVGFQTALFAGDRRSLRLREDDPRCKNLSPDVVVTDLRQLIKYI